MKSSSLLILFVITINIIMITKYEKKYILFNGMMKICCWWFVLLCNLPSWLRTVPSISPSLNFLQFWSSIFPSASPIPFDFGPWALKLKDYLSKLEALSRDYFWSLFCSSVHNILGSLISPIDCCQFIFWEELSGRNQPIHLQGGTSARRNSSETHYWLFQDRCFVLGPIS